jgi:4-alpha-glucanotransferase
MLDPAWDMMRICYESCARAAVIPMQDVLRLGSEARMNTPATNAGNWRWRMSPTYYTDHTIDALAELTSECGRGPQ